MIYWQLFASFFQIGLFSIGGGYAAMPLIQAQIVERRGWLTMSAFADVIAISEMTPGPIAINAATFVGIQTAGLPGAIVATLGCVIPSCVIVMTLAWGYKRFRSLSLIQGVLSGLRPAVIAMIFSAGLSIFLSSLFPSTATLDPIALALFASVFVVLRKWKPSPILVMLASGLGGALLYSLFPSVL